MERQAIESSTQSPRAEPPEASHFPLKARVQELENENARLKSLVGELLVANQLLRESAGSRAQRRENSGVDIGARDFM